MLDGNGISLQWNSSYSVFMASFAFPYQVKYEHMDGHFFVTASYDKLVKVWSSSTFALIKTLAGHENKVMSTDICPDGSGAIASASYDRTIKLWAPDEDLAYEGPQADDMET